MANDKGLAELHDVLAQYLELFSSRQISQYLAPNGVLEWFGRNIRGVRKIQEFLRYEVGAQYKHMEFREIERCEPIEVKPSHMKTRIAPTQAELQRFLPHQQYEFASAPSLKQRAESEMDDDDDCAHEAAAHALSEESCSDGGASNFVPKRKKRDLTQRSAESLESTQKRRKASREADLSSDSEEEAEPCQATSLPNYSPLQYIETMGHLKGERGSDWDRTVRLRISFRRHLINGELQFALIIYEHLNGEMEVRPIVRRNLMSSFIEAAEEETCDQEVSAAELSHAVSATRLLSPTPTTIVEDLNAPTYAGLRTPTKVATPTASPRCRRRDTQSGLKRLHWSTAASQGMAPRRTAPKCNAARNLRL